VRGYKLPCNNLRQGTASLNVHVDTVGEGVEMELTELRRFYICLPHIDFQKLLNSAAKYMQCLAALKFIRAENCFHSGNETRTVRYQK